MPTARERLDGGEDSRRADVDYRFDHFKLDVVSGSGSRSLDLDIAESVTAADLELTIEGASTLTVTMEDPERRLLNSGVLVKWAWGNSPDSIGKSEKWIRRGRAVDAELDDLPFRLVKVSKQRTQLTLTFEDRLVAYLRRHRGARNVSRADVTRAQFVKMLASEVDADGGIDLFIPELNKRQPIEGAKDKVSDRERERDAKPGLDEDADLGLNAAQKKRAERILDVADSLDAGPKATLAMVCAALGESDLGENVGSRGTTFQTLQIPESDLEAQAKHFLQGGRSFREGGAIAAAREHPDWSVGQIASYVEISDADGSHYDRYAAQGRRIVAAYGGGGGRANGEAYYKRYEYSRGKTETSWDAMGRLAEEVAWRRFVREGRLWYVSEDYLFRQKHAHRVREGEDGVEWIDFDLDEGARVPVAEVRVSARAERWAALPGQVVVVEGQGPADGRWLVSSIRWPNLFDSAVDVTLRKPIPAKPEPRSEKVERDSEGGSSSSGGTLREKIVAAAEASLTSKTGHRYYSQAGALTSDPTPPRGKRSDCSQWVRAVYLKAGAPDPGTWTGDQDRKGKRTSNPKPGDLLMLPNHVELYVGDGRTIGHGSPPIDYSTPSAYPGHWWVTYDFLD